ncbi:MAG: hypothetical protein KME38_28985 [Spirirestis rafaelensis WJT71-NPBG6]|jgi:hypothetical protein|nr:hypothetical protein [Spirirestis rafaelensis WJT71-NPBG6]
MTCFSTTNSATFFTEVYPVSKTGSSQNFSILGQCLTPLVLAASVATSSATMPVSRLIFNSAVSVEDNLQVRQNNQTKVSEQEAIAMFATELQRKSISLSAEDSKLWREIIASQSELGFPDF